MKLGRVRLSHVARYALNETRSDIVLGSS